MANKIGSTYISYVSENMTHIINFENSKLKNLTLDDYNIDRQPEMPVKTGNETMTDSTEMTEFAIFDHARRDRRHDGK